MQEEEIVQQEPPKLSPSDFAAQLKSKYPQYKDVDDGLLVEKMLAKYPVYKDKIDFSVKKKDLSDGVAPEKEPESTLGTENTLSDTTEPVKDITAEKLSPQKSVEEKKSYLSNLYTNLVAGANDFNQMLASIPETIYDVFALPQNAIAYATGADISASSKKFKETQGISNPILDSYIAESKNIEKRVEEFNRNYESTSVYENIKTGNYQDAFELLGTGITRSAPVSLSMMVGGATMSAGKLATVATPMFAGTERLRLDEENPEMSDLEATIKSLGLGAAESVFSSIGTGTMGKVYKDIVIKEGKESGSKIFKDGLVSMYEKALKDYGVVAGAFGEGLEEVATQITQNMINDRPLMEGVPDSFILGVGSGTVMSSPMTAIKAKEKFQEALDKNNSKKIIPKKDQEKISNADKRIIDINNDLEQNIPESLKEQLKAIQNDLISKKEEVEKSAYEKFKSLSEEDRKKLGDLEEQLDAIKQEHNDIRDNPDVSETSKKMLMANKVKEAESLLENKDRLLNAEPTEVVTENQETTEEIKEQEVAEPTPDVEEESEVNLPKTPSEDQETGSELEENLPQNENTNETAPSQDTATDGNIEPGNDIVEPEGKSKDVSKTDESSTSKREVKRVNPKGVKGEFDVEINEQGAVSKITNTKGREIQKWRFEKKTGKPIGRNGNYSEIEAEFLGIKTENQVREEKKEKLFNALESFESNSMYEKALEFFAKGGTISTESAKNETGFSESEVKWVSSNGKMIPNNQLKSVEAVGESISLDDSQEARNAIIEVMKNFKNRESIQDDFISKYDENLAIEQEKELETYMNSLSSEEFAKFESQKAEDDFISELSDQEALEYLEEQYGRQETENEQGNPTKPTSVQERSRKEEAQERKQVAFEKIDDLAQKLKDALPGIKDTDINTNGFTQDQLIDLMAKSVKHLVGTGIELDLAIQQVVASIKEKLNIDVDPENLKSKISPKKSPSKTPPTPPKKPNKKASEGFKRAKGKKSIINRAVKGGANPKTVAALEELGLTYEVESQEVAQKKAREFVEKVGFKEAVKLIKSGAIEPGAELAFIFGEVIDQLETANNKEFDETYLEIQQDIFNSFDTSAREYGRFISALNKVYNSSNYRYSLAKQTEAWKARNPKELDSDGNIPSDIMQKFKERDAKIKELENQIRETEEALAKAEANRAVQGIDEYNQRQSVRRPSKSSLKKAANALRKAKFTKSINDMANLNSDPTGIIKLVWDGAIETMAKALDAGASVEQAIKKGVSAIKKSDWYKSLNPKNRKAVEEQFENDARDIIEENIEEDLGEVSVDEDGKIKIPSKLIRKLVSDGVKDADALAQRIIDEYLSELYPDAEFTVREVRDAISGYGRTVNPSQDELSLEVSKLKNMARVLSGMEDVQKGQRPQRSGYQRREKTDQERRAEKELKAAMKDLPMDEADIDKQWKSRLDTVKSRLKNRISDLKDQIDKKERSKPERTPIEYDQEAKLLEAEKERLQAVLESIVGKPELTPEQKVLRLENGLERQVEKLQEQIDAGDIAYKTKAQKVTSPKIRKLREEQARLRKELTEMRKEAGLIEKRQLENRKNAVKRRLAELQEKRANKDYSKKERKPLPEDTELAKLKREYAKEKEKYDQEAYQDELRNLSGARKLLHRTISLMGLPRTLMATGEFSFILLQNAVPTINLALKNPKKLWRIIKATYNSYSNRKHDAIQAALEQGENYELAKSLKLGLTRTDFKESAKNEEFQGDFIHGVFKGIGDIVDGSGKKRLTTFDTVLRSMGKDVKDNPKFTLSEQVQNANPFAAMERFTNTYGNLVKMELFDKGALQLQMQGKNPAENKKDYERLAKAINTLTGRANLMGYETSSPLLNMLFFSARFALSTFNKLNPVWYGIILNDSENGLNFESGKDFAKSLKTYKPSVAQKMAISQTAIYVTTMATVITALQAIGGDDEEGNPRFTIEKDPRSSDFGKLKIGNLRYDFFGGHLPWIVLFSRISTGKIKKTSGNIMDLGEGRSRSGLDLVFDFLKNKANPFIAIPMRMLGSSEKIDGVRYDEFGNEISIEEEVKKIWPIYWQGISEYIKERPEEAQALNDAIMVMGLTGVNSQIYGTSPKSSFKSFASDIKNEVNEKRSQFFTPKKDKVTSDEQLEKEWNKFIKVHQENYAKLQERMEFENKYIGADEVKDALKQRGFNAHITNIYEKGGTIVNLYRYNNIKTRLKNLNDNYKGSKKEGAEEELRIMTEDLQKRQTFFNKKAVEYNREFLKD